MLALPHLVNQPGETPSCFTTEEAIAFVTNRDHLLDGLSVQNGAEIYLMDPDGTNVRRLTDNSYGDGFPALSPDGKKIAFDSNRLRTADEPVNTSDLFLMEPDGSEQLFLTRGSSATWSPDAKSIAFHASASGTGVPINPNPGAPYPDSRIFVANVDDLLEHASHPLQITDDPDSVDEDANWSKSIGGKIAFTRKRVDDNPSPPLLDYKTKDIFVVNPDGMGLTRLTDDYPVEERSPAWSPDGTRIAFNCRRGPAGCENDLFPGDTPTPGVSCTLFEICIMDADGSNQVQITNSAFNHLGPKWSLDGKTLVFQWTPPQGGLQVWTVNADGSDEKSLTRPPGYNGFPDWGVVRVHKTTRP